MFLSSYFIILDIGRAPHAVPTLICPGLSFYLNFFLAKKGHNSKSTAFSVMSLCLATAPCHNEQVFQV